MNTLNSVGKDTSFCLKRTINCRGKILNLDTPAIMGILNVTPDSFYDGGKYTSQTEWLKQTERMISEGAAIIDIGAASTRSGAEEIPSETEIERLLPVLTSIRKTFPDIIISVDTYRAAVARISVQNGADIINDISGGTFDDTMFDTIAALHIPYIIMHTQGTPQNMQKNPSYTNVVKEIIYFFSKQVGKLKSLGVNDIIIDTGFGFGKTLEHNYDILNHLDMFSMFELPILAGLSRKSMINKLLGTPPSEALNGTTVLNTIAIMKGADIIRVHDVKEVQQVIKIISKLNE